ncbi:putative addiction module antidote [Thermoactinomyces sp. DSM 45891]|nr:putative addiction module antidote [Thermoactinomyces sp. DSM 45891]
MLGVCNLYSIYNIYYVYYKEENEIVKGEKIMSKQFRKVSKVGSSLTVVIPREMAQRLNIRQGDMMEVSTDGMQLHIKPTNTLPENVDPRILESLGGAFSIYEETFKNLRDR